MEKLELNTRAPHFCLDDVFDRKIDLEAYRGRKVLVAFFRHAGCPFCNLRVHHLLKVHEELKAQGLEMIFFFEFEARNPSAKYVPPRNLAYSPYC